MVDCCAIYQKVLLLASACLIGGFAHELNDIYSSINKNMSLQRKDLPSNESSRILESLSLYEKKIVKLSSLNYAGLEVDIPSIVTYRFLVFQVHSQVNPVIASMTSTYAYDQTVQGADAGYIALLSGSEASVTGYVGLTASASTNALVLAIPSISFAPVPGGCCLTCAVDNDPNLSVTYNSLRTQVRFQRANVYWPPDAPEPPQCDDKVARTMDIKYLVYYFYLQENDFSEESLFDALWKMSSFANIERYGTQLTSLGSQDTLVVSTDTLRAQGIVFNVVAVDLRSGVKSSYVPAATYACSFTSSYDSCRSYGSTVSLVYSVLAGMVGIILCFSGFRLYRLLLFCCGMGIFWFVLYILLERFESFSYRDEMLISSFSGGLVGLLLVFMHRYKRLVYLCLMFVGLALGMLLSAILLYTPLGQLDILKNDYAYLLGYVILVLFVTLVLIFFPKTLIYTCSSLVGSYAVIVAINFFLRANMHLVFLSVVRRMTYLENYRSFHERPYQKFDIILTVAWCALFFVGCIVQYCTTKNLHFDADDRHPPRRPQAQGINGRNAREQGVVSPQRREAGEPASRYYQPISERTPLLSAAGVRTSTYNDDRFVARFQEAPLPRTFRPDGFAEGLFRNGRVQASAPPYVVSERVVIRVV